MTNKSDIAVSVRGLSKSYTISHNGEQHSTLAESLLHKARNPFQKAEKETFWALKDVEFDIQKGDVVGIIGRNGAGKSTLLKVLSRITEPTRGKAILNGRVGSLLEVGTGFHAELTGRENTFLNGAILGMTKREIAQQFDAIVDFSGVEQFLDTPVKRYSSGMYVRLAFAVAAHLNPEIMIVDEVLAVGDAEFQKKCLGKMKDVARSGRTVLFVSHNMAAIRQLCNSAISMRSGTLVSQGNTEDIIADYLISKSAQEFTVVTGNHGIKLTRCTILDKQTEQETSTLMFNENYTLALSIQASERIPASAIFVRIYDDTGTLVSSLCSVEEGMDLFDFEENFDVVFYLPRLQLLPGKYIGSVTLCNQTEEHLRADEAFSFEVLPANVNNAMWAYQRFHGLVRVAESVQVLPRMLVKAELL